MGRHRRICVQGGEIAGAAKQRRIADAECDEDQLQGEIGVASDMNGIVEEQREPGHDRNSERGIEPRQHLLSKRAQRQTAAPTDQAQVEERDSAEERSHGEQMRSPDQIMERLNCEMIGTPVEGRERLRRDADEIERTRICHALTPDPVITLVRTERRRASRTRGPYSRRQGVSQVLRSQLRLRALYATQSGLPGWRALL